MYRLSQAVFTRTGVVLDFDAKGNIVGIDIDHGSKIVDLSKLEAEALPLKT